MNFIDIILSLIFIFFILIGLIYLVGFGLLSLPIKVKKDKTIRLSYLIICGLVLFYLFLYPTPNKSQVSSYISNTIYCNIEINNSSPSISIQIDRDINIFFRNISCPKKPNPLISFKSDFISVYGIIDLLLISLFLISILFVWRFRMYSVCIFMYFEKIFYYLDKQIKNFFKNI
jgi:hypothetical protein